MWFILILLILSPFLSTQLPFENVIEWTRFLHEWCLNHIPLSMDIKNKEIQEALMCGKSLPFGSLRSLFTQAGMIHLMVVSGAHLMFLEKSLSLFPLGKYKRFFIIGLLTFYSFCTQMNPPVFRALVSIFLNEFSKKFQLHWDSFSRILISGLICLIINPEWITSTVFN